MFVGIFLIFICCIGSFVLTIQDYGLSGDSGDDDATDTAWETEDTDVFWGIVIAYFLYIILYCVRVLKIWVDNWQYASSHNEQWIGSGRKDSLQKYVARREYESILHVHEQQVKEKKTPFFNGQKIAVVQASLQLFEDWTNAGKP